MKDKNIIIILMYNDSESTLSLLNNIEDYDCLEKIVVVDNCSTDDSFSIVKKRENDHIHVIKTAENKGIAYGNNFGADYAMKICPEVEYYIFSNPDVIVNYESIKAMSDFLSTHADVGAVCPMELTKEEELAKDFAWRLPKYGQMVLSVLPIYTVLAQRKKKPYLWFYDPNVAVKERVFYAEVLISCFIMIRKTSFEQVGKFSERTFLYHEEDIIAYRFKEQGIKMAVLTEQRIIHLGCTSMQKAYPKWQKKSDILFDSSLIYMEDCLKISRLGIMFYKWAYYVGVFERKLFRKLAGKK